MPSDIPFLGPCPGGTAEFFIPFTWQNWYEGDIPDAPTTFTSPQLQGGLWAVYFSYVDPTTFTIHRASPFDAWIAQNLYDGLDPTFGNTFVDIDPFPGLDPLSANVTGKLNVRTYSIRVGLGLPQEGGECDCATDVQTGGIISLEYQHRYSLTAAQWLALGVPEETEYIIRGVRLSD